MHDVSVSGGAASGAHERENEQWDENHPPRSRSKIPNNAVPVREAKVPNAGRGDDLHLRPASADRIHDIRDEPTRRITRESWV